MRRKKAKFGIKVKKIDSRTIEISETIDGYTDTISVDMDNELGDLIKKLQKFNKESEGDILLAKSMRLLLKVYEC